jgi:hypothetical protein
MLINSVCNQTQSKKEKTGDSSSKRTIKEKYLQKREKSRTMNIQ